MMDHYFSLPISQLCCPESEVKGHISQLNKKELDRVCSLSSFRRYFSNMLLLSEFIGVLCHMQQYFSRICDGTDVQAD